MSDSNLPECTATLAPDSATADNEPPASTCGSAEKQEQEVLVDEAIVESGSVLIPLLTVFVVQAIPIALLLTSYSTVSPWGYHLLQASHAWNHMFPWSAKVLPAVSLTLGIIFWTADLLAADVRTTTRVVLMALAGLPLAFTLVVGCDLYPVRPLIVTVVVLMSAALLMQRTCFSRQRVRFFQGAKIAYVLLAITISGLCGWLVYTDNSVWDQLDRELVKSHLENARNRVTTASSILDEPAASEDVTIVSGGQDPSPEHPGLAFVQVHHSGSTVVSQHQHTRLMRTHSYQRSELSSDGSISQMATEQLQTHVGTGEHAHTATKEHAHAASADIRHRATAPTVANMAKNDGDSDDLMVGIFLDGFSRRMEHSDEEIEALVDRMLTGHEVVRACPAVLVIVCLLMALGTSMRESSERASHKAVGAAAALAMQVKMAAIVAAGVGVLCFLAMPFLVENERLVAAVQHLVEGCAILLAMWAATSMDMSEEQFNGQPVARMILSGAKSDWAAAASLYVAVIFLPIWVLLDVSRNFVRQARGTSNGKLCSDALGARMTNMKNWNWTSVLVKCVIIMELYVTCMVGVGIGVNVFFAWLDSLLKHFVLWQTSLLFMGVGVGLFLLPPVPGMPIYLATGIILGKAAVREGFTIKQALVFTVMFAWVLKLCACAMQQRLIGQAMSDNKKVRLSCGVHTVPTRAIQVILQDRGMTIRKVAVAVGGPDWPTSVLAGILRCSVISMSIATLPVIMVVGPTVCTGVFMVLEGLRKHTEEMHARGWTMDQAVVEWDSHHNLLLAGETTMNYRLWKDTMLSISALITGVAMMTTMFYLQDLIETQHDELAAPRVEDEEVVALAEKEEETHRAYHAATDWNTVIPWYMKATLGLGAALSIFIIAWLGSRRCFKPFSVADKLPSSLISLVEPAGVVMLCAFLASSLSHVAFGLWASRAASRLQHKSEVL